MWKYNFCVSARHKTKDMKQMFLIEQIHRKYWTRNKSSNLCFCVKIKRGGMFINFLRPGQFSQWGKACGGTPLWIGLVGQLFLSKRRCSKQKLSAVAESTETGHTKKWQLLPLRAPPWVENHRTSASMKSLEIVNLWVFLKFKNLISIFSLQALI